MPSLVLADESGMNSVDLCPEWVVRLLEFVQTTSDLVGLARLD